MGTVFRFVFFILLSVELNLISTVHFLSLLSWTNMTQVKTQDGHRHSLVKEKEANLSVI